MTDAICRELKLRKDELSKVVQTIYFGGGTPSMLSDEQLQQILKKVYQLFEVTADAEITLEANPDDLSKQRVQSIKALGINRLSIGVQSFFDQDLKLMNRAHSAGEATAVLESLSEVFNNYTIDLIYGIPGMSLQRWKENLDIMAGYGVPHFSAYALTVEPGTALEHFIKKGQLAQVSEEVSLQHYQYLLEFAQAHGYVNYEFSNFGKPGYYSKNNMAYWEGKPYLGVGPGAHSFDGQCRSWNISNNPKYIKALGADELSAQLEELSVADRYNEYVMTRLRTMWGIDPLYVQQEFGLEMHKHLLREAQKLIGDGKLLEQDGHWTIPGQYKFLSDGIASDLFYTP